MICKRMFPNSLKVLIIPILILLSPKPSLSEDNGQPNACLNQAVKKIMEIQSLPEMKYLNTLDGQKILLNEFYDKCLHLWPNCSLFKKFYYWQSEIREVVSITENGKIKHRIRCYHNCFSAFCPNSCDPQKTHGDVAEFYDQKGQFMGIAVFMGKGKYCALPFSGYKK